MEDAPEYLEGQQQSWGKPSCLQPCFTSLLAPHLIYGFYAQPLYLYVMLLFPQITKPDPPGLGGR